jgi:hypothetical protein
VGSTAKAFPSSASIQAKAHATRLHDRDEERIHLSYHDGPGWPAAHRVIQHPTAPLEEELHRAAHVGVGLCLPHQGDGLLGKRPKARMLLENEIVIDASLFPVRQA